MNTIFITFADRNLAPTLNAIKKEAKESMFFDIIRVYDDHTFDKQYWKTYESFYKGNPRGFGYWIWKPYIIKRELDRISEGDILVYLDAGCIINSRGKDQYFQYIESLSNINPIICFEHTNCFAKQYNKMDLLDYMELSGNLDFLESRQLMAGILLIKKTEKTKALIDSWYEIMHGNPHLIDDSPSVNPELDCFKEHRHDQSVFSALCYKYGINGLPQYEVYPKGGDWSQMEKYPFWAARRKLYKKMSLFERVIKRLSSVCK